MALRFRVNRTQWTDPTDEPYGRVKHLMLLLRQGRIISSAKKNKFNCKFPRDRRHKNWALGYNFWNTEFQKNRPLIKAILCYFILLSNYMEFQISNCKNLPQQARQQKKIRWPVLKMRIFPH